MRLIPPSNQRSGRARLGITLGIAGLFIAPLLLTGAAPQWWAQRQVYEVNGSTVAESSDYSPANLGQLKHFAVTAYEYLAETSESYGDTTQPIDGSPDPALAKGGVGWRLRASLGQFVEFSSGEDPFAIKRQNGLIVRKTSATTADYAMLNQGQLKALASLFYERLDAIYHPYAVTRPWGVENGPAAHSAPVTLGQLKHTFAFDLNQDSDGDGISDINEINRLGGGTNPFLADSDHDGLWDADEGQHGTDPGNPDHDGDEMPDGWEVRYGLNPLLDDAHQDFDFDWLHNITEFIDGTDPSDHYNGTRPNVVPSQPTSPRARFADGTISVEWRDTSLSETNFAVYKRTASTGQQPVFTLLGKETPAATLFEAQVQVAIHDGDEILVVAEPLAFPPAQYVTAVVNGPLELRRDDTAQTFEVVFTDSATDGIAKKKFGYDYATAPTMELQRAPKKGGMEACKLSINSQMFEVVPNEAYSYDYQKYSTIALKRVEDQAWVQVASPQIDKFKSNIDVEIGKVNTFAVYTGRDYASAGGLSTYLDEEKATISSGVSVYRSPYDTGGTTPSLSASARANHSGQWFHRDFDATQTLYPDGSDLSFLGTWEATELEDKRDFSFVGPGEHDLEGQWDISGAADITISATWLMNVEESYQYSLPSSLLNGIRFIVPRAYGAVEGDKAKRFDSLADEYPTFVAVPDPVTGMEEFTIKLTGNPTDAAKHQTEWTVTPSGGVSFPDGSTSKPYSNLEGTEVGFKATDHGEIEFKFGGVFAGKIIVKAYARTTVNVLHVSVQHVDPRTGAVSESRGQSIQRQSHNPPPGGQEMLDKVWINGGPNKEIKNHYHQGYLKASYSVRNNKDYEPYFNPTDATQITNELNTALNSTLGSERANYQLVVFWLHSGGGGLLGKFGGFGQIGMNTVCMLNPDNYTLSHEIGHALGLLHPWGWVKSRNTPADSNSMIMGYYDGEGFPFSQIKHVSQ